MRAAGHLAWLLLAACATGQAQEDRNAERAARRAQLQLQQLQQQVSDAKADKVRLEQERVEADAQLKARSAAAAAATASARKLQTELKAAQTANAVLTERIAAGEKALADLKAANAKELATKGGELLYVADLLKQTSDRSQDWHTRYEQTVQLVNDCAVKNDRLYDLSAELTKRYRSKGVLDALRQREPVLGLRDVQIFNEVQDYRDQAEAERFKPDARR